MKQPTITVELAESTGSLLLSMVSEVLIEGKEATVPEVWDEAMAILPDLLTMKGNNLTITSLESRIALMHMLQAITRSLEELQ